MLCLLVLISSNLPADREREFAAKDYSENSCNEPAVQYKSLSHYHSLPGSVPCLPQSGLHFGVCFGVTLLVRKSPK